MKHHVSKNLLGCQIVPATAPPFFFQNKCSCFVKESGEERELCAGGITSAVGMVMLGADAGVLHVDILQSIGRDFLILIICVFV